MLKHIYTAVYQVIKDLTQGKFQAGNRVFGLKEGALGCAIDKYNKGLIAQNVVDAVEKAKADIISGKLAVTDPTK